MNLSNDTYDQLLKDWWEYNDPRYIKEMRYVGRGSKGEIEYAVLIYVDDETDEIQVERSSVSNEDFKQFIVKYV